jgi:hypothetical protein
MKSIFLQTFCLVLILSPLKIPASELDFAVRAAFEHEQSSGADFLKPIGDVFKPTFKIYNHIFRVEPVSYVDNQDRKTTITGKLMHIGQANGKADQLSFRIVKERGLIKEISCRIDGAPWKPLSEPVMRALAGYGLNVPVTTESREQFETALTKALDDTWQRAAEILIVHIGKREC